MVVLNVKNIVKTRHNSYLNRGILQDDASSSSGDDCRFPLEPWKEKSTHHRHLSLDSALESPKGVNLKKLRAKLSGLREDLREQVRNEDRALKSQGANDDAKDLVGGWALNPDQMKFMRNKQYEYNASAGSILELLVFQRFWTYLASFIPIHIAPCTITAIGFFINLVTCSIVIAYSPDGKSEVPSWALFLCALGVFLYQICDALDGKQCYKVQNTQIEEFYDHGCDAVSTILLMYSVGIAVQCGLYPSFFLLVLFASLVAFYCTHWLSYVTNQMVFGKIDVTEAQWSMIIMHLASAVFGQSIWRTQLFTITSLTATPIHITLAHALIFTCLATFVNAISGIVGMVVFGVQTPLEKAGLHFERKQGLYNCLKPIIPVAFLSLLVVVNYQLGLFHLNSTWFILTFGFTYAKLTMKLVISHCTNSEMELYDPSLVAPLLLTLNSYLYTMPMIHPGRALFCVLICNAIELVRYFTCVSWDLRVALEAWIFTVKYHPDDPKSRRHCGGYYVNGLNNQEVLKRSTGTKVD